MALSDRVIEIAYKLKDQFTGQTSKISKSIEDVDNRSKKSADQIEASNRRIGASFTNIGIAISAGIGIALTATARSLTNLADRFDRTAKEAAKLGIATEELSKLQFAAELSGVQVNQLGTGLQRLVRRTAEAAQGTGAAKDAFVELGLDAKALNDLSPDQVFLEVADAMSKIPNQADRVRLGFKLFDTEGVNLINLMNDGAAGVRAMGDELEKLGGVIDDEATKEAERFNDSITRLNASLNAIGQNVGTEAIESLNRVLSLTPFGSFGNDLEGVNEELGVLLERQSELNERRGIFDVLFGDSQSERIQELEDVESRISILIGRSFELENQTEDTTQANEEFTESLVDQKEQLQQIAGAVQTATSGLLSTSAALDKAKNSAEAVKDEFSDLVTELSSAGEDEQVSSLDVFNAISRAQEALRDGDPDRSIEILRGAGDVLRTLKEEGEVADISLQDMARSLQRVASEAADAQAGDEIFNFESAQKQLQDLLIKQQELAGNSVTIDVEVDDSQLDDLSNFTPEPITVPIEFGDQEDLTAQEINAEFQLKTDEAKRKIEELKEQALQVADQNINVKADFDTTEIDEFVPPTITVPVRFEVVGGVPTFSDSVSRESDKRGFRP